mmetsp:Transcript_13154/g.20267  ORF Transcript_13154/g.20267 Transcript_13154/m.20267 type:complete len:104 (-) Transcript_13154:1136-1447(-)
MLSMVVRRQALYPCSLVSPPLLFRASSSLSTSKNKQPIRPNEEDCCGSGCENCVWLVYFSDLLSQYENSPQISDVRKQIMEDLEELDPAHKAFIEFEMKMRDL